MKQLIKSSILTLGILMLYNSSKAQLADADAVKQKATLSFEIDPIVPFVLKGIGGHLIWKPKKSNHLVFGLAIIVKGTMPKALINLDDKNKDRGWHYKINQGMGIEGEYYYKEANRQWFSGIQLFTEEINLTNDYVPSVSKHRTNVGMAVVTTGYKWYPFKKINLYFKPWVGMAYSGIISGAFSPEVIAKPL